jgi:hypothetical protein
MASEDKMWLAIPKNATNIDLIRLIKQGFELTQKNQKGCFFTISGYDFDERDLSEIPEVKELCKRAVELGLMSVLIVSTLMEDKEARAFGALEMWGLVKGKFKKDPLKNEKMILEFEKEEIEEFKIELNKSNEKCELLVRNIIRDGQNRK